MLYQIVVKAFGGKKKKIPLDCQVGNRLQSNGKTRSFPVIWGCECLYTKAQILEVWRSSLLRDAGSENLSILCPQAVMVLEIQERGIWKRYDPACWKYFNELLAYNVPPSNYEREGKKIKLDSHVRA